MSEGASPHGAGFSGFDWEGAEDLTAVPTDELARRLEEVAEEERVVGYRRRILRGRMDLLRAELSRRGGPALSPEELADALLDGRRGSGREGRSREGRSPGGHR